jgi:hypothetical protein
MSKYNNRGQQLIDELLTDSTRFYEEGKSYDLLQEYFEGFPLNTLRALLSNEDHMVKRAAIWVVAELGEDANELINDVIPLLNYKERYIKYYAIESIMVFTNSVNFAKFEHIIYKLHDDDPAIRQLAMRLVSNANESQLEATLQSITADKPYTNTHKFGLNTLLNADLIDEEAFRRMIDDSNVLTKKYGAIASKRLLKKNPNLIKYASSSDDPDVKEFSNEFL